MTRPTFFPARRDRRGQSYDDWLDELLLLKQLLLFHKILSFFMTFSSHKVLSF